MFKQQFYVQHKSGSSAIFNTSSIARAATKSGWPAQEILSVSWISKSVAQDVKLTVVGSYTIYTASIRGGIEIKTTSLEALNGTLQQLGYKPVRETSNMLNKAAGTFFIDADSPSYCDPGCEAYHSM